MSRTIIDLHVIQTVPPSNINRDDTGSPKTAMYGGVRRARVSSQAWKRATRVAFESLLDKENLGVRTKRIVELVAETIGERSPEHADRAQELAKSVLEAAGFKLKAPRKKATEATPDEAEFLVFLSRAQITNLADLAVESAREAGDGKTKIDKSEAKARADRSHSVDVALFGRMVANLPDLNVEAATQVAHALSVHGVTNEYDYYTAVDDHKKADEEEDAGAGMIGTIEFNSSTLYRYATIDVDQLQENLGDVEATRRAVEAFVRAFVSSMPTGKQNTFANRTLPDAVLVVARETQPINLVGAFEEAVTAREQGGRISGSIRRIATHAADIHAAFDETPLRAWSFGVGERVEPLAEIGERVSLDVAVKGAGQLVAERLAP
ncbi:type I-E CRISPR-associated protein Cas7/Cse4/CasC [Actinoalloteichus spitiensis]|uniref:type I-E CRISPR-associated protein Cas7/Cse4/CasC n=1 Tax=Actinoalloteichus spitiensis TaxID=252394 RepID=UPI0003608619|nr:type I-E CRISPR-associated protein Cas7/Cse4/CasC [Actinoalloteichus spitiensis]